MANKYAIARKPFPVPTLPERYDQHQMTVLLGNISRAIPGHDRILTVSGRMTVQDDLSVVYCDATAGDVDYTLLPPDQCQFIKVWVVQTSAANAVNIIGTVSGASNPTLSGQYGGMLISSDGTSFYSLGTF